MKTIVGDSDRGLVGTEGAVQHRPDTHPADDGLDSDFKPLTPEQAAAWRARQVLPSPWRVLLWQLLVGAGLAVSVGGLSGQWSLAYSLAWGALSVVIPGAVFARALTRNLRAGQAGSALAGLFVWEFIKIALTVALLMAAPRVVSGLNWLALVAGFVVTLKVYWLALMRGRARSVREPEGEKI